MTTTTPTLPARLAEIAARDAETPGTRDGYEQAKRDRRWLLGIFTRLGDERVVEAAVPAFRRYPGLFKSPGQRLRAKLRAALSAALDAAMEEEEAHHG